jgi:MSHA biogenesis protein MshJ
MKARWKQLSARYAGLPRRERMLLPGAACFAILMLGHLLLIEPARKQARLLQQQLTQSANELAVAQAQLTPLRARVNNPDAELNAQLEALRTQARNTDDQFKQLQGSLVPAQEITQWLSGLLQAQRGLHLVGLRSLSPTSVGELVNAKKAAAAGPAASAPNPALAAALGPAAAASAPAEAPADAWLYRHGVEVTVRGNYHELIAYLSALERMPRRVYWGELQLDAKDSPAVVMTLTVYTLSVDKAWWVI